MTSSVSIAEAKATLSEVVNRVAFGHETVIISRHGRPVAAVVGIADVEELERLRAAQAPGSLAEIVGQWEGFEEIAPFIDEAYAARQGDIGRDVTLE